jgi:hypothetical protein
MALAFAVLLATCFTIARAAVNVKDSIAVSRFVTPNNDRKNDTFIFQCYNTRDSKIETRNYSASGQEISKMRVKSPKTGYYDILEWDPNSGGRKPGGVYFYQVTLEDKVYRGTGVVIR